jgi:hypothetical protein
VDVCETGAPQLFVARTRDLPFTLGCALKMAAAYTSPITDSGVNRLCKLTAIHSQIQVGDEQSGCSEFCRRLPAKLPCWRAGMGPADPAGGSILQFNPAEPWPQRVSRVRAWIAGAVVLLGCSSGLITVDVITRAIFERGVVERFELSGYALVGARTAARLNPSQGPRLSAYGCMSSGHVGRTGLIAEARGFDLS